MAQRMEGLLMTRTSNKHKYLMFPFWTLFFLIGAVTAEAATYYVATTGNDAHVCATAQTIATPKRTIKSGITCLKPGDKLYIRAGTYTERIDLQGPNITGTAGSYITIAGYPGEKPTIRYSDGTGDYGVIKAWGNRGWLVFDNLILDGALSGNRTGWQIRGGNHDFILRNLEIKNFRFNGIYVEANNIQIVNCKIHHQASVDANRWYGIYFHHGANGVIEDNEIYNNPGGGIHAYPGTISNLIIRGNRIYNNNTMTTSSVGGIIVFRGSTSGVTQTVSGVQIYNNLVYKNSIYGGTAGAIRVSSGSVGTKIWNNTVYGNKGWGISIEVNSTTDTVVQNNIVFANTSGQVTNTGTRTILNANLTTDPRFVNASAGDFSLQLSSPAIDKGVLLSLVKVDIRKYPRPKRLGQDIGAYEVQ
jgi:parallel beta-helix repeat protein